MKRLPAGVWLSEEDCARLQRAVLEGVAVLTGRNGGMPSQAQAIANEIHAAALRFRTQQRSSRPGSGTDEVPQSQDRAPSTPDKWWTITQAAHEVGTSESYVRRLCRQGRVIARRAANGRTWLVDPGSAAAVRMSTEDRPGAT